MYCRVAQIVITLQRSYVLYLYRYCTRYVNIGSPDTFIQPLDSCIHCVQVLGYKRYYCLQVRASATSFTIRKIHDLNFRGRYMHD